MRMLRTVEGVNRGMIELTCFHENQVGKKPISVKKIPAAATKSYFSEIFHFREMLNRIRPKT